MLHLTFSIRICVGVLLAALLLVSSAPALAQDGAESTPEATTPARTGPRFVIRPADGRDGDYFTLVADAGTVNELTVVLGNADDVPLTLRTFVNDVVPMVNGGFSIADEEMEPHGVALWIDYPAETYTFEPETGVERRFTVTIPDDAGPGQYIAGLALQTAESLEVEGSTMFRQIIRKTIAVFIIVPGPEEPAFELGAPELTPTGATLQIVVPIENTGNVLVRPAGELTLDTPEGERVLTAPISMGSVYAGIQTSLAVPLQPGFPAGEYLLNLNLTDPGSGVSAGIENAPFVVEWPSDSPPVWEMTATIALLPDESNPVYAEIAADIINNGSGVNAVLELDVLRDGELVETFVLAPSLAVPPGVTGISQRYIPPAGFETGTWSFVLRLNVVEPSTGAVTNVLTLDDLPPFEVD